MIDHGDLERRALFSLKDLATSDGGTLPPETRDTLALVRDWIKSYLLATHRDLGREGMVCPFTAHASRIDTVRLGVSHAKASDAAGLRAAMMHWLGEFERIPCAPSMKVFRTIIIACPGLSDAEGIACLKQVQGQLKVHTLLHGMMTAVFYPENEAPGLWNADFKPLRSPVPLIVIRQLVENDAPFVAVHPLLVPAYLLRFPLAGSKRLIAHMARRAS